MKITKRNGQFFFAFPQTLPRCNPYDEDGDYGTHPTFIGLISHHKEGGNDYTETGFAPVIDMQYKDKGDQVGEIVVRWDGTDEGFRKECKRLSIDVVTMTATDDGIEYS